MDKQSGVKLQQYWQDQLEHWKESGLSGMRYCQQHDLPYNRFDYWKKKLSSVAKPQCTPATSSGFVQVVQHQEHSPSHPQSELILTLPNGAILSGIRSDHIDTLIQLLERI